MYFSTKIVTFLLTLGALTTMPTMAQRGGGGTRGGGGGGGQRPGGQRPNGGQQPDGGRPGRGPGGPFANATFVDITCSSTGDLDLTCDPRGESEDGFFVCRSMTDREGVERSTVKCIPSDGSIEGADECGCCGEDCPVACDTCPCTTRRGDPGAYVLSDDDDEPFCVPLNAAMMMVYKRDDVSCLADCSLSE
ncbi:unnamed protein product [Cylindrotheca closterium]|uniref:Uncharacterized protein n=1 Tax=Cylindrotheca closterium TaxID=2856 RepID=A0AAD2G1X8_9STRA|nr:unnamed protein product [Cylindrotheca closterium]